MRIPKILILKVHEVFWVILFFFHIVGSHRFLLLLLLLPFDRNAQPELLTKTNSRVSSRNSSRWEVRRKRVSGIQLHPEVADKWSTSDSRNSVTSGWFGGEKWTRACGKLRVGTNWLLRAWQQQQQQQQQKPVLMGIRREKKHPHWGFLSSRVNSEAVGSTSEATEIASKRAGRSLPQIFGKA